MNLQWIMIKSMLNVYQGESDDDGDDMMMMVIMMHFLHQLYTYTCIYLPYLHHAILYSIQDMFQTT